MSVIYSGECIGGPLGGTIASKRDQMTFEVSKPVGYGFNGRVIIDRDGTYEFLPAPGASGESQRGCWKWSPA